MAQHEEEKTAVLRSLNMNLFKKRDGLQQLMLRILLISHKIKGEATEICNYLNEIHLSSGKKPVMEINQELNNSLLIFLFVLTHVFCVRH